MTTKVTKARKGSVEKQWQIYTSGGEKMAVLWFRKEEVVKYFPNAKIKKDCVYL